MAGWLNPDKIKEDLLKYLGEDLYSIVESGQIKAEGPFGIESSLDFGRRDISFEKEFRKSKLALNIKPGEKDYRVKFTKDIP